MEQIECVWEKGVLLANRDDNEYSYELFQIDSFYVEIKYPKNGKVVMGLRTFRTTTLLDPYLGSINVPPLGE